MFLRDAWYCAAWSTELSDTPLGRTILGEKLVLFRGKGGKALALGGVCPHRFAPLHEGKIVEGVIQCPYHGLRFGPTGQCVLNPHGPADLPRLAVSRYPLVERHGALWIWMGDPELLDEAAIPPLTMHDDPEIICSFDRTPVKCHYEMLNDNLLDFTHVEFLHPFLAMEKRDFDMIVEDRSVTQVTQTLNQPKSGVFQLYWPEGPERIDSFTSLRWEAPANMVLTVRATAPGSSDDGIVVYNAHLVTPETETSSHYFWSMARDFQKDVPGFTEAMHNASAELITKEDGWILELAQNNMDAETDIIALQAAVLPSDKCAMRARLVIKQMLRAEARRRQETVPEGPRAETARQGDFEAGGSAVHRG